MEAVDDLSSKGLRLTVRLTGAPPDPLAAEVILINEGSESLRVPKDMLVGRDLDFTLTDRLKRLSPADRSIARRYEARKQPELTELREEDVIDLAPGMQLRRVVELEKRFQQHPRSGTHTLTVTWRNHDAGERPGFTHPLTVGRVSGSADVDY